jgi:23S rRNA G2069 N7-methylase RlmK/C1962 C5-methylase RlmI
MPAMTRPTAIVSARGAARWAHGHPWIYRSDVVRAPTAPAGAVPVTDDRGRPLGTALWSPASEISLRLLDPSIDAPIDDPGVVARPPGRRGRAARGAGRNGERVPPRPR